MTDCESISDPDERADCYDARQQNRATFHHAVRTAISKIAGGDAAVPRAMRSTLAGLQDLRALPTRCLNLWPLLRWRQADGPRRTKRTGVASASSASSPMRFRSMSARSRATRRIIMLVGRRAPSLNRRHAMVRVADGWETLAQKPTDQTIDLAA